MAGETCGNRPGMRRREFVAALLASGLTPAWTRALAAVDSPPAGFPSDVPLYRERYENWAQEFAFEDLLTFAPRTPADVLEVARWCARHDHALRPRGAMHNWSPLCVGEAPLRRMVLADTL